MKKWTAMGQIKHWHWACFSSRSICSLSNFSCKAILSFSCWILIVIRIYIRLTINLRRWTKRLKTYLALSSIFSVFRSLLMNLLLDVIQEIVFFFRQGVCRYYCLKKIVFLQSVSYRHKLIKNWNAKISPLNESYRCCSVMSLVIWWKYRDASGVIPWAINHAIEKSESGQSDSFDRI